MEIEVDQIHIGLESQAGAVTVCHKGKGVAFDEELGTEILSCDEIKIIVKLNSGKSRAIAWGCDLSYEYIKINGDYRT